jgi:Pyridoxamine 5'-phosphate oxidase
MNTVVHPDPFGSPEVPRGHTAALPPGGHDVSQKLWTIARDIIDTNLYMTLGTADYDGRPWTAPVYYACADYTHFYWVSSPEATHSRNLAERPQTSIVIFNSQVPPYTGQAVYVWAVAEELSGDDLDLGLAVYPGESWRGGSSVSLEEVSPPAPYRLYRATAQEHSILCPRDRGEPCPLHAIAFDHRTTVTP